MVIYVSHLKLTLVYFLSANASNVATHVQAVNVNGLSVIVQAKRHLILLDKSERVVKKNDWLELTMRMKMVVTMATSVQKLLHIVATARTKELVQI